MSVKLSKFKIEKETKETLISLFQKTYSFKDHPNCIILLMHGQSDPRDDSWHYPMPFYESHDHLPIGMAEYELGKTIYFDGFPITFSVYLEDQIDSGTIIFLNDLVRILPSSEFNHRYVIEGIYK